MTIQALLMLWDILHKEHGVSFLLTRRLNQDCIENLFSVIRSKGAARDNPDASQFRAALRQVCPNVQLWNSLHQYLILGVYNNIACLGFSLGI